MSMLFLLLTTGSNYLLQASFGFFTTELPISPHTSSPPSRRHSTTHAPVLSGHGSESARGLEVTSNPFGWLKLSPISNFTQKILTVIAQNGSKACHDIATAKAVLFGLPRLKEEDLFIRLKCGIIHELTLIAFDEFGKRRCAGGDYFETDVSGPNWKSRSPVTDREDGSYSIRLQMHPKFAGVYNFKILHSFSNYHGLHRRPERWFRNETVDDLRIEFFREESSLDVSVLPPLRQCKARDFQLAAWAGRWARTKFNETCSVDKRGRFKCLDAEAKCDEPWCRGPIGMLESNGWVYSAHCAFRIFTEDVAWKCLNKKWLFFWGDSNHVDTIRNFLNFVLGYNNITEVPRRFDTVYSRPNNSAQSVRITSMFNGHSNVSLNHEGLFSLHNTSFREQIASFFMEDEAPDAIIMNSGLHDGMYWRHMHQFAELGVDNAVDFWTFLLKGVKGKKPRLIFRSTIATAAWARGAAFNPEKMEVFNNIFVEKLRKAKLLWGIVDGFDLTYPWHFDNSCSDGVHYGKPPAAANWYGQVGHYYFVDLMLVHMLMHAVCVI